ncbi:MAG: hypothetical protein UR36_C0008G0009 [candidate division WS6 bacterium GW2011_GWF1_33_233]|nr:MAG: hypothetical protein UR36_C0008G0009 [candidate division WS6 bacterium GW2011_GWF1_33_233]
MMMDNNQNSGNTITKYVITGTDLKQFKANDYKTNKVVPKRNKQKNSTGLTRAMDALKLNNPFKGV